MAMMEIVVDDICLEMEDCVFAQFCYEHFDADKDGKVSSLDASTVEIMNVQGLGITSLKGIAFS